MLFCLVPVLAFFFFVLKRPNYFRQARSEKSQQQGLCGSLCVVTVCYCITMCITVKCVLSVSDRAWSTKKSLFSARKKKEKKSLGVVGADKSTRPFFFPRLALLFFFWGCVAQDRFKKKSSTHEHLHKTTNPTQHSDRIMWGGKKYPRGGEPGKKWDCLAAPPRQKLKHKKKKNRLVKGTLRALLQTFFFFLRCVALLALFCCVVWALFIFFYYYYPNRDNGKHTHKKKKQNTKQNKTNRTKK